MQRVARSRGGLTAAQAEVARELLAPLGPPPPPPQLDFGFAAPAEQRPRKHDWRFLGIELEAKPNYGMFRCSRCGVLMATIRIERKTEERYASPPADGAKPIFLRQELPCQ